MTQQIEIFYKNVDITPWVVISDCQFTSRADGSPGDAFIRVKDDTHQFSPQVYDRDSDTIIPAFFHTGGFLYLQIDGSLEWVGWVMSASMIYAFPVDNTEVAATTPRFWVLNCIDLNAIFTRSYLFRVSDPADPKGFHLFDAGTSDRDVILYFLDHYYDTAGFPDVSFDPSHIQTVASPGIQDKFRIASVGAPFGQLFSDITSQTGGIAYIDPNGILNYVDDSTVTAPWSLTDHPANNDQVGYRDMDISSKADAMANDALVWGAGWGSSAPVFARYQDSASIALHGRFQWGDLFEGASRQETVSLRAKTYVKGSVSHRRGHGDDQDFISCSVFRQGFQAGMVVDFTSEVYGYNDQVPIRVSRITFPTSAPYDTIARGDVRWDLQLSHDIDVPFARTDPPPRTPGDNGNVGRGDPPPQYTSAGTKSIDEFNRTHYVIPDGDGWGTATNGYDWVTSPPDGSYFVANNTWFVDGDIGTFGQRYVSGDSGAPGQANGSLSYPFTLPYKTLWRFRFEFPAGLSYPDHPWDAGLWIGWNFATGSDRRQVRYAFSPPPDPSYTPPLIFKETAGDVVSDWRLARMEIDIDGVTSFKTWFESESEPSDWDYVDDIPSGEDGTDIWWFASMPIGQDTRTFYFEIDYIREVGVPGFSDVPVFDVFDNPTKIDGVYHTRYPYTAGTLKVYSNSNEIFAFTESDNGHGEFTVDAGSDVGIITCSYTILNQDAPVSGGGGDWAWPAHGYVTQEFGCTGFYLEPPLGACAHFHRGIDIANRQGTPLYAPHDGTVGYVGWNPYDTTDPAFIISIDVPGGLRTGMAHLIPQFVVHNGQHVTKGQLVGYMGSTGNSTGPHCHWEVYDGDTPLDPRSFL